jgi:hypothetical protein
MRSVTVYLNENEFKHFVELVKNLNYVLKIDTHEEPAKTDVLDSIKRGFEEMQLIKEGKLKTTSLSDFLNEV